MIPQRPWNPPYWITTAPNTPNANCSQLTGLVVARHPAKTSDIKDGMVRLAQAFRRPIGTVNSNSLFSLARTSFRGNGSSLASGWPIDLWTDFAMAKLRFDGFVSVDDRDEGRVLAILTAVDSKPSDQRLTLEIGASSTDLIAAIFARRNDAERAKCIWHSRNLNVTLDVALANAVEDFQMRSKHDHG